MNYSEIYPLLFNRINFLVEQDYLFKNLPSEELLKLAHLFYMEADDDSLIEIHKDFNVNAAISCLLGATESHNCEVSGWSIQRSILCFILKEYINLFRQIFDDCREGYIQRLNADAFDDYSMEASYA